jgi:hypothetical protein
VRPLRLASGLTIRGALLSLEDLSLRLSVRAFEYYGSCARISWRKATMDAFSCW